MSEPLTEAELKDAFAMFDQNGNGHITSKELKEVLTKMGQKLTEEEA